MSFLHQISVQERIHSSKEISKELKSRAILHHRAHRQDHPQAEDLHIIHRQEVHPAEAIPVREEDSSKMC